MYCMAYIRLHLCFYGRIEKSPTECNHFITADDHLKITQNISRDDLYNFCGGCKSLKFNGAKLGSETHKYCKSQFFMNINN